MRIDAHQHFWRLDRGDYGWLTPDLTPLYRDFEPEDIAPHLFANGISGTVLVQAAPTTAETDFLLGLADQHKMVRGVVGWVDFESPTAAEEISSIAEHPKLVGLRPMIQDIDDDAWMLKAELTLAFEAMIATGLVFDALTLPRHQSNLSKLLARHPELRVVVDHASKPEIALNRFDDWAEQMVRLARDTNAFVKFSGLVTEASQNWTADDLKPYVEHLVAQFGPDRLIWGSDWPVCTLASTYDRWCKTTEALLVGLSEKEQSAVWGVNALRLYGLEGAQ